MPVGKKSSREFELSRRATDGAARRTYPRLVPTGGVRTPEADVPSKLRLGEAVRRRLPIPDADRAAKGSASIPARSPLAHASGPGGRTSVSTTTRAPAAREGSGGLFTSDAGREGSARSHASVRSAVATVLAPPARAALDRTSAALLLLMLSALALAAPATYRRLRPYVELTYGSAALVAAPPAFGNRPAPPAPKRHAPWRADEIVAGLLIAAEAARAQDRRLTGRLLTQLRERDPRVPSWSIVYRAARKADSTGGQWLRDAERASHGRAVGVSGHAERVPELL